jgi:hypothetical protein
MSCNNNSPFNKKPNASNEPATVWEHFVLHKASEKKLMLFDLDIEHKRFKANKAHKKKRSMSTAASLDAATTLAMNERQRAKSAPAPFNNQASTTTETSNRNPPQAFRSTFNPITSFSTQTTSQSTSFANSFDSVTLDSSHSITFGPQDLLALSPATFRDDAERQAALVKVRPTEGMTMKRRMLAEEGLPAEDEQLMMSGGLDAGDVRCEVCPAQRRAVDVLVEAGTVAL